MSAKKSFLSGLGIGLIVAAIVLETTHWVDRTSAIELPQPTAGSETNAGLSTVNGTGNESGNSNAAELARKAEQDQKDLQKYKDEVSRLKKKLNAKPTMRLYLPNGSNSWSTSALLKEAGVITAQNDFLQLHQQYRNNVQFKKGFYSFRENMSVEDVLRQFGAPIPTPTPEANASPSVSSIPNATTNPGASPSSSPLP